MTTVIFLGPDGSGKSSLIKGVAEKLVASGLDTRVLHTRPQLGRRSHGRSITDPHAKEPRGRLLSTVQVIYWLTDLWLWAMGQRAAELLRIRPTTVWLFDRYVHDLIVDPRRARFGAGSRVAAAAARLAPRPDVIFILDAPVEVIRSRKQEVPVEVTANQRRGYKGLSRRFEGVRELDASRPRADLADEVHRVIQALLR